ncbi:AI-2E family transporter [Candidatus Pacearchaeota archaeon]|nr:AI-2E family transporter [Candidatus Pacearchaeota archaeon]
MMNDQFFKRNLIFALLILLIILSVLVAKPFFSAIIFALVLAYIFTPVYRWINKYIKHPNLTAIVLCTIILILILIPFWFLLPQLIKQTFEAYRIIQNADIVSPLRKLAPRFFISPEFTRDLTINVNQGVSQLANSFLNSLGNLIANLPRIFLQFLIMFFIFFFTLRDGSKVVEYLKGFSPFKEEAEKKFFIKFRDITKSVIFNMFVVGLLQGILIGVGYYIFKVPQPLFLTAVSMFFGILPIIGPWVIWAPVAIGMIINGNVNGIYLAIYGLIVVELLYQLLIIYFFKRISGVSPVIALIGVLGGWYLFGIVGFVIGPLILSYLILFLEFYRTKRLHELFGE